jgi:hypothetical protein
MSTPRDDWRRFLNSVDDELLLLIRDVHFNNRAKRNTMNLFYAFYFGIVPNYDENFPDCDEVAIHKKYLPRGWSN